MSNKEKNNNIREPSMLSADDSVDIKIPPKLIKVFAPPRGSVRYRCSYGGRGSGKSRTFAKMAAVWGYTESLRVLCTRELQVSIPESFYKEIKDAIESEWWLMEHYEIGEKFIRGQNGTEFIFRGLRHNMAAIKSMAGIDLCIVEEAEDVPETSWRELTQTIRNPLSEIWVIWNPKTEGSPVDNRFLKTERENVVIAEINYNDNPWFPNVLEQERRDDKIMFPPALYQHVWEGAYLPSLDGQEIFALETLLIDGVAIPYPSVCDAVFAVIDTAVKDNNRHDGTAVSYYAYSRMAGAIPLVLLDWDIIQIEGALLETWLPSVQERLNDLREQCRGVRVLPIYIEDKASGSILIQQARRKSMAIEPIPGNFSAMSKSERALTVSAEVYRGKVKISDFAHKKTKLFKGTTRNHWLSQITGFRVGIDNKTDDLLDTFTYAILLTIKN